jgi:hypothetical protein
MRRKLLIGLFSLGVVAGFGSAAVHAWRWHHYGHAGHHYLGHREQRWADACARAAVAATKPAAPPATRKPAD